MNGLPPKMYHILHRALAAYYILGVVTIFLMGGIIFIEGDFGERLIPPQYVTLLSLGGIAALPSILVAIGIWRRKLWGYIGGLILNILAFVTFDGAPTIFPLFLYGLSIIATLLLIFFLYQRRSELVLSNLPVKKIVLSILALPSAFIVALSAFVLLGLFGIDVFTLGDDYFEALAYPLYFLPLGVLFWLVWHKRAGS